MSVPVIPTLIENMRIEGSWLRHRCDLEFPARLLIVGTKEYAVDYRLVVEQYDIFQVQIVRAGKLALETDGLSVVLTPGFGVIYRLDSSYTVSALDAEVHVLYFTFRVDERSAFRGSVTTFELDSALIALVDTLEREVACEREANRWLLHSLCEGIAARANELAPCPQSASQRSDALDEAVAQACGILDASAHTGQTPQEIMSTLGFSYRHLARRFKERYGLSPKQYQIQVRVRLACRLLGDSSLTISEISWRLTYSSPQNFSRQFKSIQGQTPAEYRREQNGNGE